MLLILGLPSWQWRGAFLTKIFATVDLRGLALLLRSAHHPRRLQEGFAIRSKDHRGAAQDVAEARDHRAGTLSPHAPIFHRLSSLVLTHSRARKSESASAPSSTSSAAPRPVKASGKSSSTRPVQPSQTTKAGRAGRRGAANATSSRPPRRTSVIERLQRATLLRKGSTPQSAYLVKTSITT